MKFWETIKEYLRQRLFAGEYAKLELARRTVNDKTVQQQIQLLTRINLQSFDHRLIDKGDDILDIVIEDHGSDNEFLKQVIDLNKNPAFHEIVEWLKREQVLYTAKEARDLDTLNFSRGSINGLVLLEQNIDRLVGVYQERVSPPEEYDNHEVI